MTLSILIDGVEVAGTTELEGLQSVSARADGSYTDSGLAIDDPAGSEEFLQLSQVVIEEDDCAQPRAFTGWVHRSSIGRGPYRDGAARVHTLEVADLNFLLHLRVLHEADAARGAETFDERMTWLLASVALDGLVWDDGLVASSSSGFDEADYRGRYADDVLAEIAGPLGRIFFVRWDPTAGHPSLFCDVPSAAVHSSTLKISNVLSDVDGSTTFAPTPDSEVTGAGEDIYDGVRFKAVGIDIYRQNPTTFATFGIHRDASYETTRIGRIATAETYAQAFLVNHSGQVDTITCTIRLPSDKLTLIEAGMRMQVRFSHLPGYETDTWVRVTGLTFTFTPGRNDFYEVQLELSNRGLSAVPGGGTGGTPLPPPSGATHWWEGLGEIPGDTFTVDTSNVRSGFTPGVKYFYHVAIANAGPAPASTYASLVGPTKATNTFLNAGIVTTVADSDPDIINVRWDLGPDGPVTAEYDGWFIPVVGTDPLDIFYFGGSTASGDHTQNQSTVYSFWIDPEGWTPDPPQPPEQGQWVLDEVVTMTGASGTTAWPFTDASLLVFHDGFDQTIHIASYDGATGAFTLDYTPGVGSTITVRYQGR